MPSARSDQTVPSPMAAMTAIPMSADPDAAADARKATVIGQGRNPVARPRERAESGEGFWKNPRKSVANVPSLSAPSDALRRPGNSPSTNRPMSTMIAPAA